MLSHHRPDTKNRSISYSAPKLSPPAYLPPPVAATPPPLLHFPNLPQAWLYPADTCWELEWDKSEFPQSSELRQLKLMSTERLSRQWGFNLAVMSLREIFPELPPATPGWLAGFPNVISLEDLTWPQWPPWKINKKTMRGVRSVLWVVGLCQMGGWESRVYN